MAETQTNLHIEYKTSDGSTEKQTVYNFNENLSDAEVKTALQGVVDAHVFAPNGLFFETVNRAYKRTVTDTEIQL